MTYKRRLFSLYQHHFKLCLDEIIQIIAKLFIVGDIMNLLTKLSYICISSLLFCSTLNAEQNNKIKDNLKVISIYQIDDRSAPGFDFFTSQKNHKCGGKMSNRYRSYSDYQETNNRKFQLILAALNNQYRLSIKPIGCEGRAMLVDYIGISLSS
jgi:hypothetical protein